MEKFCTNCGKGVNAKSRFCPHCGNVSGDAQKPSSTVKTELKPVVTAPVAASKDVFCTGCGKQTNPSKPFCLHCGVKLSSASKVVAPKVAPQVKTNNLSLPFGLANKRKIHLAGASIIVIVFVVFVISSLGGVFARDPYGLNGRWSEYPRRSPGRGPHVVLDFRGNRVNEHGYLYFATFTRITERDLTRGGLEIGVLSGNRLRNELWGAFDGISFELLGVERIGSGTVFDDIDSMFFYVAHVRGTAEGTFSISDDDRIEFVWQDEREIEVSGFQQTRNTIIIGGNQRFSREVPR